MVSFMEDNQVAEYFQAADQGDLEKVKTFIAKNRGKVRGIVILGLMKL